MQIIRPIKKYVFQFLASLTMIILSLFVLGGCNSEDLVTEEAQNGESLISMTAPDATYYYWYDGNKIFLSKIDTKQYVLFEQPDATAITK